MDAGLKYKEHIAQAATKGLNAAMELQRLRGLTPRTARQLFIATVAPDRGLRLKRMDARMQVQNSQPYQSGSEDWSKHDRGDVSYGGNKHSRSRGTYRQCT